MTRPRCLPSALLLVVAASVSSCGSLVSRAAVLTTTEPQPLFFMGVGYDSLIVRDQLGHGGAGWPLRILAGIDLPLSLCMDIVLLPFDATIWLFWSSDARGAQADKDAGPGK